MSLNQNIDMVLHELEDLTKNEHFLRNEKSREEILMHLCLNLAQICQSQQERIISLEEKTKNMIRTLNYICE